MWENHDRQNTYFLDLNKIFSRKVYMLMHCGLFKVKKKKYARDIYTLNVHVRMYQSIHGYILFTFILTASLFPVSYTTKGRYWRPEQKRNTSDRT